MSTVGGDCPRYRGLVIVVAHATASASTSSSAILRLRLIDHNALSRQHHTGNRSRVLQSRTSHLGGVNNTGVK